MFWSLFLLLLAFLCAFIAFSSLRSEPTGHHQHLPIPSPVYPGAPFWNESININLRLYYDDELLLKHKRNHHQVHDYLLSLVNAAALMYNQKPLSAMGEWHFVVQSIEWINPVHVKMDKDRDGNMYRTVLSYFYWNGFRQANVPFTNMIFFTGFAYRYATDLTDTRGLAEMSESCSGRPNSGIMVDARSHLAGMTLAHEIGHGLGLEHDEKVGCGSGYIMGEAALPGQGKSTFSQCSYTFLVKRFQRILNAEGGMQLHRVRQCFRYSDSSGSVAIFPTNVDLPYLSVSATAQCAFALGDTFTAVIKGTSNVCARLTCTNELVKISLHAALENTPCAPNKHCRAGQCQ